MKLMFGGGGGKQPLAAGAPAATGFAGWTGPALFPGKLHNH